MEKTVNGATTKYLYCVDKVVLETDQNNKQTAIQVYGSALLYRSVAETSEAQAQSYYYLYNAHGDVTALIDAAGSIAATYDYDAFGNMLSKTGDANNYIKYAGYQKDDENGLYYLNARYYDSVTARFITEDTYRGKANDPLSLNLYTYCSNNPIRYTDPSGHKVKLSQVDNLAKGIAKGAWEEITNIISFNKLKEINKNIAETNKLVTGIVTGKITLDDLVAAGIDTVNGDLSYVIKNSNILTDNKKYSNKQIEEYGKRLAGAYSEIVNMGFTVAGLGAAAKAGTGIVSKAIKGAKNVVSTSSDDVANAVGNTGSDLVVGASNAGKGFESFKSLKNYLGSPGEGNQWHHIVEQSQINKSGFSASQIQNTDNIIAIDSATHAKISGYYSSKQAFTGGKTVRDWLAGQSYEAQYEFGNNVLKNYGVIK